MKTAIITGGTRGIGFGIAKCMARDGYHLILGYNADHDAAQRAKEALETEFSIQVICCSGDIASSEAMEALFNAVRVNFNNELTAFVHNAGLYIRVTSAASDSCPKSDGDFESIFDYYQRIYPVAFKRGLQLASACQGLRHVVTVSNPGCNANQAPRVGYEMPGQAKASVEFLVRVHARLLAKDGINVNCIIPGFIKTDAWDRTFQQRPGSGDFFESRVKNSPAGRWAQPEEIGEVVSFLCSPRGQFITGVALPVDGGLHLTS